MSEEMQGQMVFVHSLKVYKTVKWILFFYINVLSCLSASLTVVIKGVNFHVVSPGFWGHVIITKTITHKKMFTVYKHKTFVFKIRSFRWINTTILDKIMFATHNAIRIYANPDWERVKNVRNCKWNISNV